MNNQSLNVSANTTDTNLLDLPYHCLQQIFSANSLVDLCSIAETMPLFKVIADYVFPKKLKIKIENNRTDVERIFRNFGLLITEIEILFGKRSSTTFMSQLIKKYCSNGTLKELTICNTSVRSISISWKPIFNRIQKLVLLNVDVTADDTYHLFDNCGELVELQVPLVYSGIDYCKILVNYFPKLTRFSWDDDTENHRFIIQFLRDHNHLKSLRINSIFVDILPTISDHCMELEKLAIKVTKENLNSFVRLQTLDQLKEIEIEVFDCSGIELTACIQKLEQVKSLETLKIWGLRQDERFITALQRLKKLHRLHLYDCIRPLNSDQYLFQLTKFCVRRLINLSEFTIADSSGSCTLDDSTFAEILNVTERRPNVLVLMCRYNFSYNLTTMRDKNKVTLMNYDDCIEYKVF